MEARQLLKDKRFWFASALITWAAALQKQESFKQKFGTVEESSNDADAAI
ncbi:hypothetical protein LINGRAHAP2_LOCUS19028 [Linum grandiflorum]